MEFATIYLNQNFNPDKLDVKELEQLFGIEIAIGSDYINAYTIDRSVIDSICVEIGYSKIKEIAYA